VAFGEAKTDFGENGNEDVLPNLGRGGTPETDCKQDLSEVRIHEHHVCSFHRNGCACCARCNACVRHMWREGGWRGRTGRRGREREGNVLPATSIANPPVGSRALDL
jgi:hypothetical protein